MSRHLGAVDDITSTVGLPGQMRLRPYKESKELYALSFRVDPVVADPYQLLDLGLATARALADDGTPSRVFAAAWNDADATVEVVFEPEESTFFAPWWHPDKLAQKVAATVRGTGLPVPTPEEALLWRLTDPEARVLGPDGGLGPLVVRGPTGAPSFTKAASRPQDRQLLRGTVRALASAVAWTPTLGDRLGVPAKTGFLAPGWAALAVGVVVGAWSVRRWRGVL